MADDLKDKRIAGAIRGDLNFKLEGYQGLRWGQFECGAQYIELLSQKISTVAEVAEVAEGDGGQELLPGECAPGCKKAFIGDSHCDKECFTEACQWDSGDCEKSCELRRMVVLGPYYKEVDHVEYQCVGPAGQKQTLSLEEGLQWEGLLEGGKEQREDTCEDEDEDYEEQDDNWRKSLSDL